MDAATPSDGPPPTPTEPAAPAEASSEGAPPVVAVIVTHDPGEWFEEVLQSFADQTYPDLSVLVVDSASERDPTPRIAAVLPDAHVHRLEVDRGFGVAANEVLSLVEGAAFYALCHDDVALEPDGIRALVEEAYRSNAGIIGPKLVDWHDPDRLLQVGMGADKTGALAPIAERHELDQEQHDAIRDVFVVPGAVTVVRSDLFAALGGFDPEIDGLGDDLDLCWRAHVAGARVLVAPVTRVRHLEALGERRPVDDRRRQAARHRLRASLVDYGAWHRLRVLPQALVLALVESLYAILAGHPKQAGDLMAAWPWNFRRMGQVRARRKQVKATRTVSDREVRELQVGGSARFSAFLRGQMGHREDRVTSVARSSRDLAGAARDGARQFTGAFAIILTLLLVVGTRGLILHGIPAIGEFSDFPTSPGTLLQHWWSGWRHPGLGAPGAQPTGLGLYGALGYLVLGATSLLRSLLILGCIPVGAIGAWRLAKPIGSARASVASFAVYLAIPVPYNALARGSWSGLMVYALAPWMLLALGRASGAAPFGPANADPDEPAAQRHRPSPITAALGLGLGLAFVAVLVPFVVLEVVAVAAALTLGSILCFRVVGLARMLVAALGAAAVAVALHLPWALSLLRGPSPWESVAGVHSSVTAPLSLGQIVRFESGPWGAPPLGWAFLLAGALPVIIGRAWRLEWAVRAWMVVLGGWGVLWAAQQGHLPGGLPAAEVVLAPVAAALALAAALGLAAFEIDLKAYRFGWRQVVSVLAALGVVLGAAPLAVGLIDGRWDTPQSDYTSTLSHLVDRQAQGGFRVVWMGDPEIIPVRGWRYNDQLALGTTDAGSPTVAERFAVPEDGASPLIARAIHDAQSRRTNRLGRLLAPMGIRYLVVQEDLAPSDSASARPDGIVPVVDALDQQLDLEQVPVSSGITVYQNLAWVSTRAVLPPRTGDRTSYEQADGDDLRLATPVLRQPQGVDGATGQVRPEGDLLVSATSDPGWKVQVSGVTLRRGTTYGWANQFDASAVGAGTLSYDTPIVHRAVCVAMAVLWLLVLVVWRRRRRRERRLRRGPGTSAPAAPAVPDDEPLFVAEEVEA